MERIIPMSTKEVERAEVLAQVKRKTLSQNKAAEVLNLTERHVRRLFTSYKKEGAIALVSKKRGALGNHQLPSGVKDLVIALIQEKYPDFGPTLAHEKIKEVHGINISVFTVRHLMIANELWKDKKIKRRSVYQLRERRSHEGELVQTDGSPPCMV